MYEIMHTESDMPICLYSYIQVYTGTHICYHTYSQAIACQKVRSALVGLFLAEDPGDADTLYFQTLPPVVLSKDTINIQIIVWIVS